MTLRDREWPRFLNAPDPELLSKLYEPGLAEAVSYDRCCAYFSSSVLSAAARGFGPFVERLLNGGGAGHPPVRLLVNEELSREDVDAMLNGHGADALAEKLSARLLDPRDALESERLSLLGLLVKQGLLEVRVGVMRSGYGILHAKFGIINDAAGDAIVFSGSGNESASGLIANYEELEITGSWADSARFEHFRKRFEDLWANDNPSVAVFPLPVAVKDRIVRYASKDDIVVPPKPVLAPRQRREVWMRWRFAREAPWFPGGARNCDAMAPGIDLWPHQIRVVEEAAVAWPAGRLLCDEVGMGKTVEAIMILRRLLAGRGVRRALLLVPAGILRQWQGELREKGGLLVPRLEGQSTLVWPDGRCEEVNTLGEALQQPILLVSREMARLEQNASVLLNAPRWDLVLLDEAHAARRAHQVETEFNSATLLLELLRKLQLNGQARGILLLSATPMQTHPWEPWDLLGVLGEGAPWLSEFRVVREFYESLDGVEDAPVPIEKGRAIAATVTEDSAFPALPVPANQLPVRLLTGARAERSGLAVRLRDGAPLGRRMHRNTRQTLQKYFKQGLIDRPPAERCIQDVRFDFIDPGEREVYDGVRDYVERRFRELEEERAGKGFVMTVYRRRAASSPRALRRSLERRRQGLEMVARGAAASTVDDLDSADQQDIDELLVDSRTLRVPSSLPDSPVVARQELREVERLLRRMDGLQNGDSKLAEFTRALQFATDDGRPCLVFSEFTDTVEYLRDSLFPSYGSGVACYTGMGGTVYENGEWIFVSKEEITRRLRELEIRVLLCSDAASEGLNLQAASALINYDLPWNPARVEQRIGRIDRIGQHSPDLRIVNLLLADSVDERVYKVLDERCDLFRSYVGAMQPVLSIARKMLLGVEPFDVSTLHDEANRAKDDVLAAATFRSSDEVPPAGPPAGVTIEDLARAYGLLKRSPGILACGELRPVVAGWKELADDPQAVPLSPFTHELRRIEDEAASGDGELLPLVMEAVADGPFKSVVAVWAGPDGDEVVERAERLEALFGMWNGGMISQERWKSARSIARELASETVARMRGHADREERVALERQIDAARRRLLRELARILVCSRDGGEELNQTFHRMMGRSGQTGALLQRAHGLVGYPEWPEDLVRNASNAVARLSHNQRTNLILGTPLEAAIRDPRWAVIPVLNRLTDAATSSAISAG